MEILLDLAWLTQMFYEITNNTPSISKLVSFVSVLFDELEISM